jgi:hypothetical protein
MAARVFLRSVRRLLVRASIVPSSPIIVILVKEALSSSETLVLTGTTRCKIPEDGILHSHLREYLKSYIALTGWTLYWRCNMSPAKYELSFLSQKTTFFVVSAVKTSNLTDTTSLRLCNVYRASNDALRSLESQSSPDRLYGQWAPRPVKHRAVRNTPTEVTSLLLHAGNPRLTRALSHSLWS